MRRFLSRIAAVERLHPGQRGGFVRQPLISARTGTHARQRNVFRQRKAGDLVFDFCLRDPKPRLPAENRRRGVDRNRACASQPTSSASGRETAARWCRFRAFRTASVCRWRHRDRRAARWRSNRTDPHRGECSAGPHKVGAGPACPRLSCTCGPSGDGRVRRERRRVRPEPG